MSPARFRWGMLLILIGALFLMRNMDIVSWDWTLDLFIAFPFLLIAIGVEKIFTKTKLEFISYLTTIALVAGGLYIALEGSRSDSFFEEAEYEKQLESGVNLLTAVLELDGNDIEIRDSRSDEVYASFRQYTLKPVIEYHSEGDEAEINIRHRDKMFWDKFVHIEGGYDDYWKIAFPETVPLQLVCSGEESDISMNLATTPVRDLKLNADFANVYIKLGRLEPLVTVKLNGDDTDLKLRVPQESGLRLTGLDDEDYLTRIGLVRTDGQYITTGYDTSENRIDVELDDRFRSLSIDFY